MDNHLTWILDVAVNEGQDAAFRDFMNEMVSNTQTNEPRTLVYEWNMSPDGRSCHIHERYFDSHAAMEHLGTFRDRYMERFFSVLTVNRCVMYGSPSEDVTAFMAQLNPEIRGTAAGFFR